MYSYSIIGQAFTDGIPGSQFISTVISADSPEEAIAEAHNQFPTATDFAVVNSMEN